MVPQLAAAEQRRADRDADFELAASEAKSRLDQRTQELPSERLSVCGGRTLDALECRAPALRNVERVAANGWVPDGPGHFHFSWTLKLASIDG